MNVMKKSRYLLMTFHWHSKLHHAAETNAQLLRKRAITTYECRCREQFATFVRALLRSKSWRRWSLCSSL